MATLFLVRDYFSFGEAFGTIAGSPEEGVGDALLRKYEAPRHRHRLRDEYPENTADSFNIHPPVYLLSPDGVAPKQLRYRSCSTAL